jgi:flagellar biosynthesis protein FliQ
MTTQQAVELIAGAITTAAWICFPLLAGGLIGIAVSLVQILTSIRIRRWPRCLAWRGFCC